MSVTIYFLEFIVWSFAGWIWESFYCTVQEKHWADRGFLFGPVCPIYGSCMVIVTLLYRNIPIFASADFEWWKIFLICCVGSAIAEYSTSWFLEKRFHARWWDYSALPLNLNGRICLPVSLCFGAAGIVVVRYLLPAVNGWHIHVPGTVIEVAGLIAAAVFGADYALTEASLSRLLKDVERMHQEFNERAQSTYELVTETPGRIQEAAVSTGRKTTAAVVSTGRRTQQAMVSAGRRTQATVISTGKRTTAAVMETGARTQKVLKNLGSMLPEEQVKMIETKAHVLAAKYVKSMPFSEMRVLGSIQKFTPEFKVPGFVPGFAQMPQIVGRSLRMTARKFRRGETIPEEDTMESPEEKPNEYGTME